MSEKPRIQVTRAIVGICHMQVCADKEATDEEILAVCNQENPAGTTFGWTTVCREIPEDNFWKIIGPVVCQEDSNRLHILVSC